jgi:hypothetical protein
MDRDVRYDDTKELSVISPFALVLAVGVGVRESTQVSYHFVPADERSVDAKTKANSNFERVSELTGERQKGKEVIRYKIKQTMKYNA